MADWPSVIVTGRISTLLETIKKVNKPAKLNRAWLESNGFKSKNDRAFVGLLTALGYLDGTNSPTDKWGELKGSDDDRKASIGRQLAVAYPAVFANYPVETIRDSLSKEQLKNFVRPKVPFGEATVEAVVDTFFALKALGTFDAAGSATPPAPPPESTRAEPASDRTSRARPNGARALEVTINLSLEIPPTNDADVYDKLFAAMSKHLGSLLDREP